MERVAIYVRVSTTEQALEGYSIPAQISLLTKYAEGYKYTIYKTYQDAGISGKNIEDRPGLLELLEDAKQDKFDMVLIWKLSRLSRSLLDLLSVASTLKQHNISLISYSEHFDTSTPIGKMLLQLLGSIAEFERNTIIENVRMGMNERFKQGLSKSSIPFGYYYEGRNICVDSEKASAVKEIFTRCASGASIGSLVDYLNGLGFRNRLGKPWRYEVILSLLQNEFYTGLVTTGRKDLKNSRFEVCKGVHEPIINAELFHQVQKLVLRNKKSSHSRRLDAEQLLSGLVTCPFCGSSMYYVESSNIKKGKRYYSQLYRCGASNPNRKQCKGFSISRQKVDGQVLKKLEALIDIGIINEIAASARNIKEQTGLRERLNALELELQEVLRVRDRYFSLFEGGKVDMDVFADRINEVMEKANLLTYEKEQVEKALQVEEVDFDDIPRSIKSFFDIFESLTPLERREVVRTLVEKVGITANKEVGDIELVGGFIL